MVILLTLLMACQAPEPEEIPHMDAVELLTRTSLDLRGIRPTTDEFQAVQNDPTQVEVLIEEFLYSENFGPRAADLFTEVFLTQTETYYLDATAYGADVTQAAFIESIGEEVPQMVAEVAKNDLPWTDLVQGNWTMANETLAKIWPVTYPENANGWQRSSYTDGRPGSGVLSTNSMWWRYTSTVSNANRKRANAISRIFLCHDYLLRKIDFDRNVNLLDQESVDNALQNNAACVNCHSSLDPLAGYLYGFWHNNNNSVVDVTYYHPEREQHWRTYSGIAPEYYGTPGYTLTDLGNQLASDNRVIQCAVEHSWELLLRRQKTMEDTDILSKHREAFLAGELTLRALFRSIIQTPQYRAGLTDEPGTVSKKMVTPKLLASQIEGLTGFRWTREGYDVMGSDTFGYLTLAGGADGYFVTAHATQPNATLVLVQERLAEAAAAYAVHEDRSGEAEVRLFHHVDFTETPETDREAMVAQIQALHQRIYGQVIQPDGEEVLANLELWSDLHAVEDDIPQAWVGLLSALLREPALLFY
jgi:hypothetical protein